jgi:hypothetical protein
MAASTQLFNPTNIAVDSAGNCYISESGENRVRKVSPEGKIIVFAGNGTKGYSGDGGLAIDAKLNGASVAVDLAGNLHISDSGNNRIRKVTSAGIIGTVAGNGMFDHGGASSSTAAAKPDGKSGAAAITAQEMQCRLDKEDGSGLMNAEGKPLNPPVISGDAVTVPAFLFKLCLPVFLLSERICR